MIGQVSALASGAQSRGDSDRRASDSLTNFVSSHPQVFCHDIEKIFEEIDDFINVNFKGANSEEQDEIRKHLKIAIVVDNNNPSYQQVKPALAKLASLINERRLFFVEVNTLEDKVNLVLRSRFTQESFSESIQRTIRTPALRVNFIRDFVWAAITSAGINFFTSAEQEEATMKLFYESLTQFISSVIPMAGVEALSHLYSDVGPGVGEKISTLFGAALAIFPWNFMQYGISDLLTKLGCNDSAVGYLSAILVGPGFVESPFQKLFGMLGDMKGFVNFFTSFQIVDYLTVGRIPGNAWQLAFQAAKDLTAQLSLGTVGGALIAAIFVALTVGILNVAFTLHQEKDIKPLALSFVSVAAGSGDVEAQRQPTAAPPPPATGTLIIAHQSTRPEVDASDTSDASLVNREGFINETAITEL